MIVAIHQPNFLPWLGYFHKMAEADRFVLLDSVAFSKGSYTNRVRIVTPSGSDWLTVPVATSGKSGQTICDVACNPHVDWRRQTRSRLEASYREAPHYQPYAGEIGEIIADASDRLADLNISLIGYIADKLAIDTECIRSSEMLATGASTELLIRLCRESGATTYLSGSGARGYQDEQAFQTAGIELRYDTFHHPEYTQPTAGFQAGLSAVDLLFNAGPRAASVFWEAADS